MSSGATNHFQGSFAGVAADITIAKCPFRPRVIKFWTTNSRWGLKIDEEYGMDGANYVSSVGADVGVTINDAGFVVASGADINTAANRTYFECED